MSDISDPGRVGRRDRKSAQKLIDAAYAAGGLTAADRALRTQRVESAHTKGDLAVIVRDLNRVAKVAPAAAAAAGVAAPTTAPSGSTTPSPTPPTAGSPSLGSAIPPDQLAAMSGGSSARVINLGDTVKSMTSDTARRMRRIILIVVLGFVLLCGLGLAGIVGSVVKGINHAVTTGTTGDSSPPAASVNLQTAKGWSQLVAAIDKETGTSKVYDAVVYPEYASINAIADEGAMRYLYRNGSFQLFNSPVTPAPGRPIDLADIKPKLIEGLPEATAKRQGMPEFDSAYLIINRLTTDKPQIMVYVQQTGKLSRWSIYDLDGKVIGGTPG